MPYAVEPRRVLLGTVLAAAMFAAASVATPRSAWAASCCGGNSATQVFTLAKYLRFTAGADVSHAHDVDQRRDDGRRQRTVGWSNDETRLTAGGAVRLGADWQASAALPAVVRYTGSTRASAWGMGVGDAAVGLRWEILDEETCFARPATAFTRADMKPTLHAFTTGIFPSGRFAGRGDDPLGADLTGRGAWVGEAGFELGKVWGHHGQSLELAGGYEHPHTDLVGGRRALRASAVATAMWYPAYQTYVGLWLGHRQQRWFGDGPAVSRATDVGLTAARSNHGGNWRLRGRVAAVGVVEGRGVPMGVTGGLTVMRVWY